jgi:hypothetical protein
VYILDSEDEDLKDPDTFYIKYIQIAYLEGNVMLALTGLDLIFNGDD